MLNKNIDSTTEITVDENLKEKVVDWALERLSFPHPGGMTDSIFTENDISQLHSLYGYYEQVTELEEYLAQKGIK
jgi:hypothetical protein